MGALIYWRLPKGNSLSMIRIIHKAEGTDALMNLKSVVIDLSTSEVGEILRIGLEDDPAQALGSIE